MNFLISQAKTYDVGPQKNHDTISSSRYFEHPKHMLKMMDKKCFLILCPKIMFYV